MKIIKLSSQNVKRLSAVEITPEGNLVVIGGDNDQGKSSVIDSIIYALGGTKSHPIMPVRHGEKNAEIVADLGDIIVKRTFTAAGGTNLVVTNKDGAKYPSPQAILDKLVGTLSFDPLEFARRTDTQAETLRKLVGLDFTAQDAEAKRLYDERTLVNREVKEIGILVDQKAKFDGVPDEEIPTAEIVREQQAASETNAANARLRIRLDNTKNSLTAHRKLIAEWDDTISKMRADLANAEAKRSSLADELKAKDEAYAEKVREIAALEDIDLKPFQARAQEAESTNSKIRANKERAALVAKKLAKQAEADGLTTKIDAIECEKTTAITGAKYPIPGLSFDKDGNVIFNGIPFSQASSANQTKVSIAIGIALNPKLRVLLIRDGSLLDAKSLALVAEFAAQHDAQVWMERVSTGGEVSVIIEDGMVKES